MIVWPFLPDRRPLRRKLKLTGQSATVIWSIDPRLDDLDDLILLVRQFAADMLDAGGIGWHFQTPPDARSIGLTPEQRRQSYLILKEAINNIACHAKCTTALLEVAVQDHQMTLQISDDGCGFDSPAPDGSTHRRGGHGLENMRSRAARLGGQCRIESARGSGTRITVAVPLRRWDGTNVLWRRSWKRATIGQHPEQPR